MIPSGLAITQKEKEQEAEKILVKIKYLIFFRLLVATFLLGLTLYFQGSRYNSFLSLPVVYLSLLAGSLFFFTAIFALYLKYVKNPILFAYGQLLFDTVFVSLIILFTGGITSIFSFGYMIVIIIAATILSRRGSFIIASASCILYGIILDLQYYGALRYILPPELPYASPAPSGSYLYTLLVTSSAFYLVAYLSSHLTEELKKSKVQLKAKQKDLAQLELLNKNIVQSINSGLITLDNSFRIIYFNRAASEIIGIEHLSELLNIPIENIFPNIMSYMPRNNEDSKAWDTRTSRGEMVFTRKDGKKMFLGFSLSRLRGTQGEQFGHILVFQDLTLLKKMEQQVKHMERLALAGEMAAVVAHEIKNPLASMSGSIQMLKSDLDLNPLQNRLMNIVSREIDRLNSLVKEFSLLTKTRTGTPQKVDLNKAISDTLTILKSNYDVVSKINIIRQETNGVDILIDPQQLQQVLWNLFANAVEAMPDGGTLTVKTAVENTDEKNSKHQVVITISDTGSGIPPEIRSRIFDPFYTTKTQGTGLGLSIVRRIIADHGGRIILDDTNSERGATFKIYFPKATKPQTN